MDSTYSYIIKSRRNIRQYQVQNNSLHNCHYDRIISYSPERGKGWSKTENLEVTQGGSQIAPTVALNITNGYGWLKGETFHQDLGKLLKEPDYWWVLVPNLSIVSIVVITIVNVTADQGQTVEICCPRMNQIIELRLCWHVLDLKERVRKNTDVAILLRRDISKLFLAVAIFA